MKPKLDVSRIAFDLIVAKLDTQRTDIQNVRNQAAISAAVTGLLATVFASIAEATGKTVLLLGDDFLGFSIAGILLVGAIITSLAFAAMVVISWSEFTFSFNTEIMLKNGRKANSPGGFLQKYVEDGEWFFRENESKLSLAQTQLWWAMVLGWVQIFPWLMIIVGNADGR